MATITLSNSVDRSGSVSKLTTPTTYAGVPEDTGLLYVTVADYDNSNPPPQS